MDATAEKPVAERPTLSATGAPLAVIRAAHVEYSGQDKAERAEKVEKTATHASDKSADKPVADKPVADKATADKPAEGKAEAAHARNVDRQRSREALPGAAAVSTPGASAPTEHEPGVADAVQTRVADAGH
jgi:ribonuclease-3